MQLSEDNYKLVNPLNVKKMIMNERTINLIKKIIMINPNNILIVIINWSSNGKRNYHILKRKT